MKGAAGWLNPLWQLFLMRLRTFTREPSATFWVFGFPLLMSRRPGPRLPEPGGRPGSPWRWPRGRSVRRCSPRLGRARA